MNRTPLIRTVTLVSAFVLALAANGAGKTIGNYSYDDSDNISSIGPDSDGLTNYYYYDSAGRLIRFARKANATADAVLEETYEYDSYGNVTKFVRGNAVDAIPVDTSTNRLDNATYDAAGNVATYDGVEYQFDPVGTLTQKSGTWGSAFYIYTADDERIGIEGPDDTWRYTIRDIDNKVLREWSAQSWNGNLGWVEDYVYRDGTLAAAARPDPQGGIRHFHVDHLGSPRLITGPAGQQYASHDYFPFGREITDPRQEVIQHDFDTPEPMKFTGHERDFAGSFTAAPVDYMHARYYVPHLGRFLSMDPSWEATDSGEPQTWNRYAYVENNPLRYTDPDGEAAVIVVEVAIVGALAVGTAILGHEYLQDANQSDPSRTNAQVMASQIAQGLETLRGGVISFAQHVKGKRQSTKAKHQKGQGRKAKDKGGEKGDKRRRDHRKRPKGHKGPWAPTLKPKIVPVPDVRPQPAPQPQPPAPPPAPKPPAPKPPPQPPPKPNEPHKAPFIGYFDHDRSDSPRSPIRRSVEAAAPQRIATRRCSAIIDSGARGRRSACDVCAGDVVSARTCVQEERAA